MGLMDIFKNKNRELKKTNQFVIDQLLEKITNVISESKDFKANDALNELKGVLRGQAASASQDSFAYLGEIEAKVDEARKNIIYGRTNNALNLISQAISIATTRASEIQNTGGDLTRGDQRKADKAEKAKAEAMAKVAKANKQNEDSEIARLEAQKNEAFEEQQRWEEEEKRLLGILRTLPVVDRNIERQMKQAGQKARAAAQRVNMYDAEIRRVDQINEVKQGIDDYKEIVGNRKVSDGALERIQQQHAETIAARKEDALMQKNFVEQTKGAEREINALNEEIDNIYYADENSYEENSGYATANPYATGSSSTQANPYATASTSSNANPYAQANPYATAGTQANPYAPANSNTENSFGSRAEIEKALSLLKNDRETYSEKCEEERDKLKDLDSELVAMLNRYDRATPSEQKALKGDINQKKAERATVLRALDAWENQRAQLNEKIAMMENVKIHQGVNEAQARNEKATGGRYADLERIAMDIDRSIDKQNENLDRVSTANAVANRKSFNTDTMIGSDSDYENAMADQNSGVDEFAGLRESLGMVSRN